MLTKIMEFSVRNKLIIGLLVMALIGIGAYQTTRLPIDAVPDITDNQVQIITIAPSFGATDIERLVTFPIEQANSNISGTKEIRSFSRFGLSLVTIVFEDGIDIYWARQQVAERLQQVQQEIPKGIGVPTLGPISTGLGEIYQYVVRPAKGYEKKYDVTSLRTIQDWIVRRQILGVKGVAEVSSFGGKLKQYEISVDPDKLHAYGITINDIFSSLENNNENTGGAYIEKGPTVLYIRSEGLIGSIEDIEQIAIKSKNNELPLLIRDVAEVKIGFATRYGAMTYNDEGEVSGAVVMMLKGANSSEVIKNVKERIEQIRKTLPEGVIIEPFLDRTKMVDNAIHTVERNLLEGALIVVFVLVLFLGNIRAGLLVASVIPLSLLFAICMMNLFGIGGNLMSLGALDFGLIIDGAVIIVEAVMHQLTNKAKDRELNPLSKKEMDNTVVGAASRMMNSAVFGQVIILVVYLPILTLQGIEGKMFKPMAQTVAFALLGAFLLSLTYVPMMSSIVLSRKQNIKKNFSDRMMEKLETIYKWALLKVLKTQKLVFGAVVVLFALAIYILSHLGGEFIPSLEEGDFAVDTRVLTGSNLNTTIESTQKAAHVLLTRFPEVTKVVTKIGSGEVPTDPMPMEASDMMVILKDKSEWTSAKTFPELSEKMGKALEDVPGITAGFQFPVQMRFNELMTGARQDVVLKVFGEDLDSLAHVANSLGKIVSTVKGTKDLYIEPVTGLPQIIINYKRLMLSQHNLSVSDINKVVNAAFAGQSSGLVFEGEKRFDMVVRLNDSGRQNLEDVQGLLIPTPNGGSIPLAQLADVKIEDGPNQIQRENAQRRIVVGFNVKGRDVQSIVEELQAKVEEHVKLPTGYSITYGGAFENLNRAKSRLMIAVPISLLLIFLLLFFAFRSVKESLLIYTAIPLSIIGGVFLLALRGLPFSISAGVGFIALFGVAVLNGIVLIGEFKRLRKEGMTNLVKVVVTGGMSRLRPVLMTAMVASLGFLPMAISNGAGAEVQRPLATVVIGGLLVATLLTLLVLPILYLVFENGNKMKLFNKKTIITTLVCILSTNSARAQVPLTLPRAIDKAMEHNLFLKGQRLGADYAKANIRAAIILPATNIDLEYGQVNSAYLDNKIAVSQSFAFPIVYKRAKELSLEEWRRSLLTVSLKEYELKKLVTQTFYDLLYWQQKAEVLIEADTLYTRFYQRALLRLDKGESNVLEKATAENQMSSIRIQLKHIEQELDVSNLQMQLLLNVDTLFAPILSEDGDIMQMAEQAIDALPAISIANAATDIAKYNVKVERSKLLPELMLGYNNNSFKGNGPDEKYYTASSRFHSVQAGIAIPIFNGGQRAKVTAARIAVGIAENEYLNMRVNLSNQYQKLLVSSKSNAAIVTYLKQSSLKNAKLIRETAERQFYGGEINYLDYVLLTNQSITIQDNYIDALKALNDTIIQLNYLSLN